jgi:hypothetical protein
MAPDHKPTRYAMHACGVASQVKEVAAGREAAAA